MRIERLTAEGIFSFGVVADRFDLEPGDGLTAIVGPNASGKSNVGRALGLVQAAMRFEAAISPDRGALSMLLDKHARSIRHEGMPTNARSTVQLRIRLTGTAEAELMTSFIQALVVSDLFQGLTVSEQSLGPVEAWVLEQVTPEAITDLLQGTIVVSHSGIPGMQWNVAYDFEHEDTAFTWHIASTSNMADAIAPRERSADAGPLSFDLLTTRLGANRLPGLVLPPDRPFSMEMLLPTGNSFVNLSMPPLNANFAPSPHREFVAAIGLSVPDSDPLGPFRRTYSLAAALSAILDRSLRYLGPAGGQLAGTTPSSGEADLVGRLHDLKNGDQLAQRRYSEVQSLFEALAPGRRFELRTDRQLGADGTVETTTEIEILPAGVDLPAARPRPLQFAGTGIDQALTIAETLVGEPDRVVVLDEPATNLHPPWQRIVRSYLGSRAGQCLLITHSPYLMPSEGRDQLARIVRFSLQGGATHPHRLSPSDLSDERWIDTMVKELAWSADARGLLFAAGVVLLEGPTELAALPAWFAKSQTARRHGAPDDLHVAFYSVGGDQDFQPFVACLQRFGVPWAVVCDGAAFRFDIRKHILEQVLEAGVDDPELDDFLRQQGISAKQQAEMTPELFTDMVEHARAYGVFSLASGWHRKKDPEGDNESFEAFVASLPELAEAAKAASEKAPKSKPRAGRLLAEGTDCPTAVDELYGQILERLWQKGMARYPARPVPLET